MVYRCFKVYELSFRFANEYKTDEPGKSSIFDIEMEKIAEGIILEKEYLREHPLVKYLCIEESLYKKLYKEAREELKKIYYAMSTIPRQYVIDHMIKKITKQYKKR